MHKITKWLKFTCEDTSLLISERMDHSLPIGKRLRARLHMAICGMCRVYEKQLMTLRSLARQLGKEDVPIDASPTMSPETKARLKQTIKSSN